MRLPHLVRQTALATAGLCFSLQAEIQLPESIVTATRTSTAISRIGKSVEVITRSDIEKSQQTSLIDVLRRVPGINVAGNGRYGVSSIFLRGAESYHTKILINGAPIADVTGTKHTPTTLANIDLNNIERIEIVKGPQTVLHGSDAIGGVINIITRKGASKLSGFIRNEIGENKYARSGAGFSGGTDRINWSVSGSVQREDGISALDVAGQQDDDDYFHASLDGRLGIVIADGLSLNLSANYVDAEYEYDSPFGLSQFQDGVNKQGLYAAEFEWYDTEGDVWQGKAGISYLDTERQLTGLGTYLGDVTRFDLQHTHKFHDLLQLTVGGNYEEQEAGGQGFVVFADSNVAELFVQNQMQVTDALTITGGLRWLDHATFGNHTTWQLDAALVSAEGTTRLRGSVGTGFRAPSLYELFDGFSGNSSLQPEESLGFDLGVDHQLTEELEIGATYFRNEVDDLIDYVWPAGYVQAGESLQTGVEVFAKWQPSEKLKLHGTYVYLDAENRETGRDLARRPDHAVTLGTNWQATNKLNLDAQLKYAGDRYSDPNNTQELDEYVVVDVAATFSATENLRVFARALNLFDEDYELVSNYNTYGRTFYAGVELRF
jgi:vitamin B12 transporter